MFAGFQSFGIGALCAGALGSIEQRETDAHTDSGVVLLEAVGHAKKFSKRSDAGTRRDVIVLKVIELRKQSVLGSEVQAGPKRFMFCLCPQVLGAGVLDGGLDGRTGRGGILGRGFRHGGRGRNRIRIGLNFGGGKSGQPRQMLAEHVG